MFIPTAVAQQHPAEATLLARFVAGDPEAANSLFRQLGSNDQSSLEPVLEVIGSYADLFLWQRLLQYMAAGRSLDGTDRRPQIDSEAPKRAAAAIGSLFLKEDDPPAVMRIKLATLSEGLTDPEPGIRHTAARLLGLQGDARAITMLIEAAVSGEREFKLQAIGAVGQLKDERGGLALTAALASDDDEVHWAASQALKELKAAALPALIQALRAPKAHVRWHAACGLGDVGDVRAASNLAEAFFDDDFSVRGAAVEALAKLGAPAVPEILQRIARRVLSEEVCQAAYHALQQLAACVDRDRLRPVLEALRGRNASVEAPPRAVELLETWGSKE